MSSHGYVPTAVVLPTRIRLFAAFWDQSSIGRIGYVDVSRDDPTKVIGFSTQPSLDVGEPGTFDAHGVTPMSVNRVDDQLWLHYAGWQRVPEARYLLFSGLAISDDDGATFRRHAKVPVLDRSSHHFLVRTGFFLRCEQRWQAWVAQSTGLPEIAGKLTPQYALYHLESEDGINWPHTGDLCFELNDVIFGYGRTAVWRGDDHQYHGLFSVRRRTTGYSIEYSRSPDGRKWESLRKDQMAFHPDHTQPSQRETMFANVVHVANRRFMFYNGDSFGREGIRAAIWDE
jgi:hypothetical protein